MFGTLKSALLGLAAAMLFAVGAQAAPVNFTVNSTSLGYSAPCDDGYCNALLVPLPVFGTQTADTGVSPVLTTFSYTSLLRLRPPFGESGETLNIEASIILNVAGTLYTYIAQGAIADWAFGPGNLNVSGNPVLSWTSFSNPANSPLNVVFNTDLIGVPGFGPTVTSSVTVSVVPLPAGVLLLLTGLLSLFGLSRRRRAIG